MAFPIDSKVRLPITIGWPSVSFRNLLESAGTCHGNVLSRPMTLGTGFGPADGTGRDGLAFGGRIKARFLVPHAEGGGGGVAPTA